MNSKISHHLEHFFGRAPVRGDPSVLHLLIDGGEVALDVNGAIVQVAPHRAGRRSSLCLGQVRDGRGLATCSRRQGEELADLRYGGMFMALEQEGCLFWPQPGSR